MREEDETGDMGGDEVGAVAGLSLLLHLLAGTSRGLLPASWW